MPGENQTEETPVAANELTSYPVLPHGYQSSTIGAEGLNCRLSAKVQTT